MNTNTTASQDITFDAAMTQSRFFARNMEAMRASIAHPDYLWNAAGQRLAKSSVRQALRIQLIPATAANMTAAMAYISEGK